MKKILFFCLVISVLLSGCKPEDIEEDIIDPPSITVNITIVPVGVPPEDVRISGCAWIINILDPDAEKFFKFGRYEVWLGTYVLGENRPRHTVTFNEEESKYLLGKNVEVGIILMAGDYRGSPKDWGSKLTPYVLQNGVNECQALVWPIIN